MFEFLFNISSRWPKTVLLVTATLLAGAAFYGAGVFSHLTSDDGFSIPGTESYQVAEDISSHFQQSRSSGIFLFESTDPSVKVTDPTFMAELDKLLQKLDPEPEKFLSFYNTGQAQFLSKDKSKTYAAVTFPGSKDEQIAALEKFQDSASSSLITVNAGGQLLTERQATRQVEEDLRNAELISLPILAVLLLLFFRSPIAAALPILLGVAAIIGGLGVVRGLTHLVDIDQYAINVITILGLGLAVDYSLLMVNRFKEELRSGRSEQQALRTTVLASGRTIFFSGVTVMTCLLVLSIFPIGFLRSVGLGGSSALLVAVLAALIALPALLAVVGKNINKWTVGRRANNATEQHSIWLKVGAMNLRHPYITLAISGAIILAIAYPFLHVNFTTLDYRSLAQKSSSYKVAESLNNDFEGQGTPLFAVGHLDNPTDDERIAAIYRTTKALADVENVEKVEGPLPLDQPISLEQYQTMFATGRLPVSIAALANARISDNKVLLTIHPADNLSNQDKNQLVNRLREVDLEGGKLSFGGELAVMDDTLDIIGAYLPWALAIMALAIFVLFTLLLQSIVIPLKTIIINGFTLLATFGILTVVFQDGWFTDMTWLSQTGGIQPSIPILIFAVAFGLSMDYAAFLYGRMHEEYVKTHDSDHAVLTSLDKTGGIITAAAVLLFVVVAAFASSQIAIIQQVGLGLAVAVLLDAFVIRMFLVPAIMKLLGDFNWYAPDWLKRWHIRHQ